MNFYVNFITNNLNYLGYWRYNSARDEARYYKMDERSVKSKYSEINIESDRGIDYLHIKGKDHSLEGKVHVFVSKDLFTYIKHFFLKYLTNNWTQIKLYRADDPSERSITLLIDNKNLMENREVNKAIESAFEFALRPKIKELEEIPARPVELADWKKREAIIQKWASSPLIKNLLLKQLELNADQSKIDSFRKWYDKNKIISLTNKDPSSDEFPKELVAKLREVFDQANSLPEGFEEIGLQIKKEFISKISEHFLGAFIEKTKDYNTSTKDQLFKISSGAILLNVELAFSQYEKDLKLIKDEFAWRWRLILGSVK